MRMAFFAILLRLLSSTCIAQFSPIPTDTRFVTTGLDPSSVSAQQNADFCYWKIQGVPITYTFLITRVVGGATAVDFNGTITDPPGLVSNGVVSKTAKLKFSVSDGRGDYALFPGQGDVSLDDEVSVNGNVLAKARYEYLVWPRWSYRWNNLTNLRGSYRVSEVSPPDSRRRVE
jgi:hypothetical protein